MAPKVPEAALRSPRKNASPVESIANCLPIIVPSLLNRIPEVEKTVVTHCGDPPPVKTL